MNKIDLAIRNARINALIRPEESNSMDQDGILIHDSLVHSYLITLRKRGDEEHTIESVCKYYLSIQDLGPPNLVALFSFSSNLSFLSFLGGQEQKKSFKDSGPRKLPSEERKKRPRDRKKRTGREPEEKRSGESQRRRDREAGPQDAFRQVFRTLRKKREE